MHCTRLAACSHPPFPVPDIQKKKIIALSSVSTRSNMKGIGG